MKKTLLILALSLAGVSTAQADSVFPLGKEMAGDAVLPRPYGVGADIVTMDQNYAIDSLSFTLPGVTLPNTNVIKVKNHFNEEDIKLDAWVLPFLNVFGVYGHINAETDVNLSAIAIPGLPVSLGTLPVRYKGTVYGGGMTLAYGNEHWFASLTGTWTRSSLSGDFNSSVKAHTWQPRVGLVHGDWQGWVGAFDLHTEEEHKGVIGLPGIGNVPFDVKLKEKASWSPMAGVRYDFSRMGDVTLELGGGKRTITMLNFELRFPRDKE